MLSIYTVCFFGHRQVDNYFEAEEAVEKILGDITSRHEYVECLVGRDGDFDQIVASAVLRLKKAKDSGNISLTWVMPYLKSEYTKNQDNYDNYYDSVEVCEESASAHPKAAIQIRNKVMVDRSDYSVFYVKKKQGGAYQTMRYAANQGKEYINLADDNSVSVMS